MNLEQLKQQEKELSDLLSVNRNKQRDYYTTLFCEKYKIKIGDTIKFKDGKDTVVGVINRFDYSGVKPNYPVVSLFNSDGKVGKREKRCYYSSLESIEVVQHV